MQITRTTPNFTGHDYIISKNLNKGKQYLYNNVVDILAENPVPAIMKTDVIEINAPKDSNNIKKVLEALEKAGIKFQKK